MRNVLSLLALSAAVVIAGCGGSTTSAGSNAPGPAAKGAADHAGMNHASMDHSATPAMVRLQRLNGAEFDAAFASQMIEHHQGAVEMSERALPNLKRDEVKEAARKIIADQEKEIAQMTGWVKEWTGAAPGDEDRQLMKADMAPMMTAFTEELKTDADRAFLTHMKAHHQMAVDMAKMAVEKAEHPELKELANNVIATQTKEMQQFDAWLGR